MAHEDHPAESSEAVPARATFRDGVRKTELAGLLDFEDASGSKVEPRARPCRLPPRAPHVGRRSGCIGWVGERLSPSAKLDGVNCRHRGPLAVRKDTSRIDALLQSAPPSRDDRRDGVRSESTAPCLECCVACTTVVRWYASVGDGSAGARRRQGRSCPVRLHG